MRIFIPATVPMLRPLVDSGELRLPSSTAFALTPTLRETYTAGDTEELEYVAMQAAARGSLRLISSGLGADDDGVVINRRVVVAVDLDDATPRPDLEDAAVGLATGPVPGTAVAAVHVDAPDAEQAVRAAAAAVGAADLGDHDAEFSVGEAEDHQLGWYATQELRFLLELM